MTLLQLKNAGIATNSWNTLQNTCNGFLFSNEGYIYVTPKTLQFYFEESSELLFLRFTKPSISSTKFLTGEYVEIEIVNNGELKKYYARPADGGAKDSKIGIYHQVFDINEITAII